MSMPISSITATAKGSSSPGATPTDAVRIACPNISCISAAAIGERTAFIWQANSTARGRAARSAAKSPSPVQDANQGEQAACGIGIDRDLPLQPLHQDARAVIVDGAAAHIERLDLFRRRGADRLIITVADGVVVLDDPAQRR